MFLLFVIIYLLDGHDNKYYDIVSFLAGLIFISKQSIGIFLLIPILFYSKNKIKSLFIYLIPFICLSIYLLIQGAFYDFINYCFLGMFDFASLNNNFGGILFWVEVFFIFFLFCYYLRYRDIQALYILFFQFLIQL